MREINATKIDALPMGNGFFMVHHRKIFFILLLALDASHSLIQFVFSRFFRCLLLSQKNAMSVTPFSVSKC